MKDGGPAFPRPGWNVDQGEYRPDDSVQYGMSLRDWFAGQVIMGHVDTGSVDATVQWAYQIADAMIAEREKERRPL